MIRSATHDDIPRIIEMAQAFYATTNYAATIPMTDEQAAGIAIVTMESGVMLVADNDGELVGMICIHVAPFLFNPSVMFPSEIAFYVDPKIRGGTTGMRLLRSAEAALIVMGVPISRMAMLPNSPEAVEGMYRLMGYKPDEVHFMKALN